MHLRDHSLGDQPLAWTLVSSPFFLPFLLCSSDPQTHGKMEDMQEAEREVEEEEGGDQTHGNLKREEEIQLG